MAVAALLTVKEVKGEHLLRDLFVQRNEAATNSV